MNRQSPLWLKFLVMSILATWFTADALAHHSGTWKWTTETDSGQTLQSMVKLRRDGRSFAGVFIGQEGKEIAITEPKLDGRTISFQVTREHDGQQITVRYIGKIAGHTVRGKQETHVNGQKHTLPWEAKRVRKVNATGTWKWSRAARNGQSFESALRLKQDGTDVSGLYVGRGGNETPIVEGKLERDQLTFQVSRERNGQQFTIRYQGKIEGDSIRGKIEFNIDDQVRSRPWEAKRVRPPANAAGLWTWNITQDGQTLGLSVRLKQNGKQISGAYIGADNHEWEIADAKLHGNEISFQVTREHNGAKVTSKYHGRIMGDIIHGASESGSESEAWRANRAPASP